MKKQLQMAPVARPLFARATPAATFDSHGIVII